MLARATLPYRAKRTARAIWTGSQPAGQPEGRSRGTRGNAGRDTTSGGSTAMLALLLILLLLFLLFGGLGLFVAKWLLIICLIALVAALITGGTYYRGR
jgi:uncharacterized membrane protein